MVNYSESKIYKIWSPSHPGEIYIGSTTQPLAKRIGGHRGSFKRYQNGKYPYTTSFKILEYGDARIELIENFECKCKEELIAREGFYIRKLDCVNKKIEGRTKKQYLKDNKENISQQKKQYYEDNKEKIRRKMKQYREDNKNEILQKKKQYYEEKRSEKVKCECGSVITRGSLLRHKKSKKHMNIMLKKN